MANNDKIITVLNGLIEIQNDRIEGYSKAIENLKDTQEHGLKSMFKEFISTSQQCKSELVQKVSALGGKPAEGTTASGKLYRVWMDVRDALMANDRLAALQSCEGGEDAAQAAYKTALEGTDLPSDVRSMLVNQKANLKTGHDRVKVLRDQEAEAHAHH